MIEKQFSIQIMPLWRGDGPFSETRFVNETRVELRRILRSQAGRALAASLRWHNKKIYLMPYEGGDCNAQEDGVSRGSDTSVVLFTPWLLKSTPCTKPSGGNSATLPHERLFHELVHSLRRISLRNRPNKVTGRLLHYSNTEEFIAILATNIFISDVTNGFKTSLRGGHAGHLPLDQEFASSFRFFSHGTLAFNIVARFCDENRGFTRVLSNVRASFNPIAAYYKNRQKAFNMAADGDAEAVFESITPMDYFKDTDGAWKRIVDFPRPELP